MDLVHGNVPDQLLDLLVGQHFGDSDHNSVSFTLATERHLNLQQRKFYNWGRGDYNAVRQVLASIDWNQSLSGKCTAEMWSLFKEQILRVLDLFVLSDRGHMGE